LENKVTTEPSGAVRIVAVDGPAAAGKTTTSKILAEKYGLLYLESGRAYRIMAYHALRNKVEPDDEKALIGLYHSVFPASRTSEQIFRDSAAYDDVLRGPEVSRAVSKVSKLQDLRARITDMIRSWAAQSGGVVVEGRDIGTAVFPTATVKFYLTAAPEIRARRRATREAGSTYEEVLDDVIRRDHADATRKASPLFPAEDSMRIDTSRLSIEEVVCRMSQKCDQAGLTSSSTVRRDSAAHRV
jgi:cytidylate kinase